MTRTTKTCTAQFTILQLDARSLTPRRKMGGGRPAAAPPASERGGSDGVAAFFASNDSCKVALSTKGSALSEKI